MCGSRDYSDNDIEPREQTSFIEGDLPVEAKAMELAQPKLVQITDEDMHALKEARSLLSDMGLEALLVMTLGRVSADKKRDLRELVDQVALVTVGLTHVIGDGDSLQPLMDQVLQEVGNHQKVEVGR